ncbi:hypothetical protein BgiMline_010714 [Biomphalaria glabrata]|nr:Transposable element Hobo transposase [Biomphalaria glabrata]
MSKCKLDKLWAKKDLEELIKDGGARLVPATWTKSECWTRFRCVEIGNEIIKEFAVCKQWEIWLSVPIGHTTTLQRHNASHTKVINVDPGQFKMTSVLPKKSEAPKHFREKAHRAAMYMIAKDIQPFSCLHGDGFCHFAQAMIDIGSKYGSVSLDDIICDRTTLSKSLLPRFYNEYVQKLKKRTFFGCTCRYHN